MASDLALTITGDREVQVLQASPASSRSRLNLQISQQLAGFIGFQRLQDAPGFDHLMGHHGRNSQNTGNYGKFQAR